MFKGLRPLGSMYLVSDAAQCVEVSKTVPISCRFFFLLFSFFSPNKVMGYISFPHLMVNNIFGSFINL